MTDEELKAACADAHWYLKMFEEWRKDGGEGARAVAMQAAWELRNTLGRVEHYGPFSVYRCDGVTNDVYVEETK